MSAIETVREFLDMCIATRRSLSPDDQLEAMSWSLEFRHTLEETYHIDLTDPAIVTAVAAGVVEGMSRAVQQDSLTRGALECGWALYDLARPHLAPAVAS